MRILYFYQYFTTPCGAWSTRVYEMARRWVECGDRVTVVTSVYDKSDLRPEKLVERFDVEGIEVIVLNIRLSNKHGMLQRLLTFAAYALLASWYGLRLQADVVVASSGPITVGIPGLVARYLGRRPFVFEVRDLWPEGAIQLGLLRNRWARYLAQWFERQCYSAAAEVIALSPGQAEGVRRVAPQARISIVPNASDIALIDRIAPLPELPAWAEGRQLILYTGTIGQANDCWQLVHAAERLAQGGRDDIAVVMIGDGKDREAIEQYVCARRLDNVHLLGLLSKEEVVAWLQRASASLLVFRDLPVLNTNSPNKLFDSLAAGVPIVQTTQGWIKELLEEENCGLTVQPGDSEAMAKTIAHLVDAPELQETMGRNARRVAEEQFDRELLACRMRSVLARVAGERAGTNEPEGAACGT